MKYLDELRIGPRGSVRIPEYVRETLKLEKNAYFVFERLQSGQVMMCFLSYEKWKQHVENNSPLTQYGQFIDLCKIDSNWTFFLSNVIKNTLGEQVNAGDFLLLYRYNGKELLVFHEPLTERKKRREEKVST